MYQDKMAPKLFLISLILIFLVAVSQAKRPHLEFFKLLNQASEDQKIQFLKTSFEFYDANNDGFLTSDEYDNVDCGDPWWSSKVFCLSYIREAVTEALIQFEQENENGIKRFKPINKIGITFEDCKDALKRQLEQIYAKKRTNLDLAELNQASEDQKTRFFKTSFELYDSNQDGFVTSDEFDNVVDFGTLPLSSFIRETMTEALIQFEQEHETCTFISLSVDLLFHQCHEIPCNKIGITFEDYKDALKRKLEQIFGKKVDNFSFCSTIGWLQQLTDIGVIRPRAPPARPIRPFPYFS